jgi:hypothetical protein
MTTTVNLMGALRRSLFQEEAVTPKIWIVLMERNSGRGKTWYDYVEAETAEQAIQIAEKANPGWRVFNNFAREEK